jgi:hypothetical protein
VDVRQRSAGVSLIDRSVGLDRTDEGRASPVPGQVSVFRADDTDAERAVVSQGASDGQNPLANDEAVAVGKLRCWQPGGFDLEQRQVADGVFTDELRREHPSIAQFDVDRLGLCDNVMVGNDVAVRCEDDP